MRRHVRRLLIAVIAVAVLVGGTAIAQTGQRFSDVPADHPQADAIHWAADAGVTTGYGDGTFRPSTPLSKDHALIFMERFYDDVLGADVSDDFTRSDMMELLHTIHTGQSVTGPSVGKVGYVYYDWPPAVLEPGIHRLVGYISVDDQQQWLPLRMADLGTGVEHVWTFETDMSYTEPGSHRYVELGCGYDPARLWDPDRYMNFILLGTEGAGIVYHQKVADCPPEFRVPRSWD
ncbi:MAG: S-layer homology domain-containing protein [Acidimicrobiaceae bacterium]|nr:S-layer homology domain-containing protein [Acidimicrobiaceae bacterium]MYH76373.1 S-layer homology domain-containing protein [Acidimicrobiaceae bacterium]